MICLVFVWLKSCQLSEFRRKKHRRTPTTQIIKRFQSILNGPSRIERPQRSRLLDAEYWNTPQLLAMPAIDIPMQEETKWHSIPVAEILTLQSTSPEGLSDSEAEARLKQYGTNELTPPPKPSFLMKVFIQINNILIYILIAAAIVAGPFLPLPFSTSFAHLDRAHPSPRLSGGLASLLRPEIRVTRMRVVLACMILLKSVRLSVPSTTFFSHVGLPRPLSLLCPAFLLLSPLAVRLNSQVCMACGLDAQESSTTGPRSP